MFCSEQRERPRPALQRGQGHRNRGGAHRRRRIGCSRAEVRGAVRKTKGNIKATNPTAESLAEVNSHHYIKLEKRASWRPARPPEKLLVPVLVSVLSFCAKHHGLAFVFYVSSRFDVALAIC